MDRLICEPKTGEEKLGYLAEAAAFPSLKDYCAYSKMEPRKLRDWERQLEIRGMHVEICGELLPTAKRVDTSPVAEREAGRL